MVLATVPFCAVSRMTSFAPKYPPEMVERSHWPFLPPKACGQLPVQPTHPGMLQATPPPLLQKSALVYNSKGAANLPKFPSSYSNYANKLGRKFTGQDAIAKSSVKLLAPPKPKTLKRLNSLTEVQRRKGRTIAPEQITQLSACKYLQNSIHSSETFCTSEAAGRQQWKQNTHCSDFKISTSNSFLQLIRSINEVLLNYQSQECLINASTEKL